MKRRFMPGASVVLASATRSIPAYGDKPAIGHDTVLRVRGWVGRGTQRDPLRVICTDGCHFWHLDPECITPAEVS